jgi:crotonobetainyl-CoA:carnitine CoA-transferase CaiB-like acyl-CoA transferase
MKCADGKWLALHMSSPEKFWLGLADAIEQPTLLEDPRFADRAGRIANQEALIDLLGAAFAQRDRADWCARLEANDVPHAPMYDASEALDDPQAKHLELLVETSHPEMGRFRTVRPPVSFDGERTTDVIAPPTLGEHNAELLAPLRSALKQSEAA